MIHTQDMMEKLMPVTEEKEREDEENIKEEEEEETEEEEIDGDDEEEGEEDAEEKDGRVDKEKEEEEMPEAADETQEKIPLPAQPKDKKPADVLNLNNEVVKMRKEVKRVRALIIRKLTRQIVALKRKKGKEIEIERNQRRADRLLEEIHAMKVLLPDLVTKTALQKNLNFEQVCKNPKSNISDRAVARIATHPQYNRKIEDIKAAVKAFKEERMKDLKEDGKEKVQKKAGQVNPQSPDKRGGRKSEKEEEDITTELIELSDDGERDSILIDTEDSTTAKPEKDTGKAAHSAGTADVQKKEIPESESVRPGSKKSSEVEAVRNEPQNKDAVKKPIPSVLHNKQDTEGSDLETSDEEEKEYFDDSTEERFHKQSSQSEESDDDFFVGKVSKIKKKKQKSVQGDNKVEKEHEVKGESIDKLKTSDKDHSELDELESRLKSKAKSLQSVFCTSLSGSKQRGGIGKGRGGDKFRGQRNPKGGAGLNRDFSKQSKFQKQVKETGAKHSRSYPEGTQPEVKERGFASSSRGRGRGRGRGDVIRQKTHMSGGVFSNQAPQQALHPSWEASKKRKEQQGQILAFQGKKIKFDDDDD